MTNYMIVWFKNIGNKKLIHYKNFKEFTNYIF